MNKEEPIAIVWKQSVIDNGFKCQCGKKLWNGKRVCDDVLLNTENNFMYCPDCMMSVGMMTSVEWATKNAYKVEEA